MDWRRNHSYGLPPIQSARSGASSLSRIATKKPMDANAGSTQRQSIT
jgi:hypothetical protein